MARSRPRGRFSPTASTRSRQPPPIPAERSSRHLEPSPSPDTRGVHMKRIVPACAVVAVLGAVVATVPAAAGPGTFTRITSPKGPGQHIYQFANLLGTNSIVVSGVVSDDVRTGA